MTASWRFAQQLHAALVLPRAEDVAASGGDREAFEASVAAQVDWITRVISPPCQSEAADRASAGPWPGQAPCGSELESSRLAWELAAGVREPAGHPVDLVRVLRQIVDGDAGLRSLKAAAAAHRDVSTWRHLGLRLLRGLLGETAAAREPRLFTLLFPSLQEALEETLRKPYLGLELCGGTRKRQVLRELAALLKEVHQSSLNNIRTKQTNNNKLNT